MEQRFKSKTYASNAQRVLVLGSRYTPAVFARIRVKPWLSSIVLLPVCFYFLLHRGEGVFLDSLTLLIHEAGHLCFFFLGDALHAAGGTLMQVVLPATLAFHFWQYHSRLGIQVSLLWLGQNFLNVSVYAADARAQALDLLPGGIHDWTFLLGRFGLLEYDQAFAFFFCFSAMLCFIAALLWPPEGR